MSVTSVVRGLLASALLVSLVTLVGSSHTTAEEPTASRPGGARGIIVKTTTAEPSRALLDAAARAVGSDVSATRSATIARKIASIEFGAFVDVARAREASALLRQRDDVVWAVPDALTQAASASPVTTNDAKFSSQRNLWDTRSTDAFGLPTFPTGGYSSKATSLWQATRGASHVVVAVLDTGITPHPDLAGQTVKGYDMIARDPFGDYLYANDGDGRDADPTDPGDWRDADVCSEGSRATDSTWHGTKVAGIVAAKAGNSVGIAGVAPGVKIQPVRVLGTCGGWPSDIIAGITWASGGSVAGVPANPTPAKVINLSFGIYLDSAGRAAQECSPYDDAVAQARARGTLTVVAAGSNGRDVRQAVPGSCDGVISVGSTGESGARAVYSNFGPDVDLTAQGGDARLDEHGGVWTTSNAGTTDLGAATYEQVEGTSMAAPVVSAGAALLFSLGGFTPAQVERALLASVEPFPSRPAFDSYQVFADEPDRFYDLNCTTAICGAGILDLSRVPAPRQTPTISGNPYVGQTLTATTGSWVGAPATVTGQWYRNGTPIPQATAPTRAVVVADLGTNLAYRATATKPEYPAIVATSDPVTIVKSASTVTVAWANSRAAYGTTRTGTVVVRPVAGVATGAVEIREGTRVLARATLVNGAANVTIPGKALGVGPHAVRAAYLGGSVAPSLSAPTSLGVSGAVSKISLKAPKKVKKSRRATVTVTVAIPGATTITGKVRLYDGKRLLTTVTLSAKGKATVKLPKIAKKGTHKLKAVYVSTTLIKGKTSAIKNLKVTK